VIRNFRHRGLERLFEKDNTRGVRQGHVARLRRILVFLNRATGPQAMNIPGFRLHQLIGDRKGTWAVNVSGNWRVTFAFDGNDAVDVDYVDYH
jgi:toxin HigB-1